MNGVVGVAGVWSCVLSCVGSCAGVAAANTPGDPGGGSLPVLAGPAVGGVDPSRTLVQIDHHGNVRRLEGTPEEAALALLPMAEGERVPADRVLAERARVMDDVVRENLSLLKQVGTASKSGRRLEMLVALAEFYGKLQPLRDRGLLHDEIEAALPAGVRPEFNRLVASYWEAIVEEGRRELKPDGTARARVEIVLAERFEIFSRELSRSFKRHEATAIKDALDGVMHGRALSVEQQRVAEPIMKGLAEAVGAEAPKQKAV